MKWLAVVLIVINLAAYLLVGDRQTPQETVRSDSEPDVNKTGMLLLAEVDASQSAAAATAGDVPDQTAIPVENPIDGSADQSVAEACYRLGPFRQEASWQAAKMWMGESGFGFRPVTTDSRRLLAFRVYLGPFASESSADAILKNLESQGLKHFRYRADNGLIRISMGLFSQEELAEKHLNYLISNQYEAKLQPEYRRLGPLNWMEIPSAGIDQARLLGHDWDESGIRMTKVNCRI